MINGRDERRVTKYLGIDHCAEGYGWVKPADGEEFWGIPHHYYSDGSQPFIEVQINGRVIRTVNVFDLSEIEFAAAEAAGEEW